MRPVSWLRRFRRARTDPDALLNEGLELAMDWGADWFSPINARLLQRHPHLGAAELAAFDATCQAVTRLARETLHRALADSAVEPTLASLSPVVLGRYPWVDRQNLERLLRHGVYHAAKAGGRAREP